jgi:hypothetical protein
MSSAVRLVFSSDPSCHIATVVLNEQGKHGLHVTVLQLDLRAAEAQSVHRMNADATSQGAVLDPEPEDAVTKSSLPLGNNL